MAIVSELITKIEIKGSLKKLDSYRSGMKSAIATTAKLGAAVGAVGAIINGFVVSTLAGQDSMIQLSRSTNVSVESIQELGFAASQTGSDVGAVESTIQSLSQKIGDAAQKGSEDFARLGISIRDSNGEVKNADQVLGEVSNRFKELNLSLNEQRSFAGALGIDESLIQLLGSSSDKIKGLKNEARSLGIITTEQSKKIVQFNDSFTKLKFGLDSVRQQVSIALAPSLQSLSDRFTGFIAVNKELIQNGISKVIKIFNAFVSLIVKAAGWIDKIISNTIGWKVALAALGVVLALTLSPIYLIIAGITAAILIIDDLIVAFNGGNSVIRDFVKDLLGFDITPVLRGIVDGFTFIFGAVKKILMAIVANFMAIWSLITGDFDGFKDHLTDSFKLMFGGISDLIVAIFPPFQNLLNFFKGVVGYISEIISGAKSVKSIFADEDVLGGDSENGGAIQDRLIEKGAINSNYLRNDAIEDEILLKRELSKLSKQDLTDLLATKDVNEDIQRLVNQQLSNAAQSQLTGSTTNNNQANTTTQNNNVTIEVRGDNAQQVAGAVNNTFQKQLETSSMQLGKGGR
jgi:hypothetical protein